MNPKDKIHSSWLPFLTDMLEQDELLKELNTTVLPNSTYFPPNQDIFNVFLR
jgi:uracil DNA glycosylase